MKKRFLAMLIAIALLSLTGCHGTRGKSAFRAPEAFDTSRNYEITFWAKNDTNKTQTQIYQHAIAAFEKLYPNISVNMRLYTDYGKIYNDVITNIPTDTTPNVCITYPDLSNRRERRRSARRADRESGIRTRRQQGRV